VSGEADEAAARRLAAEALAAEDPTGWFERLYVAAEDGRAVVPWDRRAPHRLLVEWAEACALDGGGRRALVVGCGLGADAEYLAGRGFATVAFDVAATAVRTARQRFPDSAVRYVAADLLDPPVEWGEAFDFVLESLTVQSLPDRVRPQAIANVGRMVAPGGSLLVIATARDEADGPVQGPPWPLTRAEVDAFATGSVEPVRVEDVRDPGDPIVRWRAEFCRQASAVAS
jgi:SAM-dependent methyltransferase